ncbi:MAG: N-acetylneuraminate synthase family protein [Homoserinimonas sp.]
MGAELFIIAEAGVNHNGSLDRALEMVGVAASAGADAIKFQTFSADKLAGKDANLAEYQKTSADDKRTQWDLLKSLELSHADFLAIEERCDQEGIVFLSTGFDIGELHFLVEQLSVPVIKIASGDLTYAPMLFEAGLTGLPIVLSTGMANLDEIDMALDFIAAGYAVHSGVLPEDSAPTLEMRKHARDDESIQRVLQEKVTILHCTTQYPAPPEILNLNAMTTIAARFNLRVGYSDHSMGFLASTVAVSLGATVIEKHFTLDKSLEGPDHAASLSAVELVMFIDQLRSTQVVLGSPDKACQPEEEANRTVVRRSLVAAKSITEGQVISVADVECRRPGTGRTSFDFWDVVGTAAERSYSVGEHLD